MEPRWIGLRGIMGMGISGAAVDRRDMVIFLGHVRFGLFGWIDNDSDF